MYFAIDILFNAYSNVEANRMFPILKVITILILVVDHSICQHAFEGRIMKLKFEINKFLVKCFKGTRPHRTSYTDI